MIVNDVKEILLEHLPDEILLKVKGKKMGPDG